MRNDIADISASMSEIIRNELDVHPVLFDFPGNDSEVGAGKLHSLH